MLALVLIKDKTPILMSMASTYYSFLHHNGWENPKIITIITLFLVDSIVEILFFSNYVLLNGDISYIKIPLVSLARLKLV